MSKSNGRSSHPALSESRSPADTALLGVVVVGKSSKRAGNLIPEMWVSESDNRGSCAVHGNKGEARMSGFADTGVKGWGTDCGAGSTGKAEPWDDEEERNTWVLYWVWFKG